MFAIKYRLPILTLVIVLTILGGLGLPKIEKRSGIETLISESNKDYLFYKDMENEFGANDQIVLGITFSDTVYSGKNLEIIKNITESIKEVDGIKNDDILSLASVEDIIGDGFSLNISPLINSDGKSLSEEVQSIRSRVLANNMLKNRIVSKDEKSSVIIIPIESEISMDAELISLIINKIDNICSDVSKDDNVNFYRSGMVSVKYISSKYMEEDMSKMFPLAILIVLIIFYVLLKRFTGIIIPILVTLISVVWTLGLKGWLQIPLTISETIIPVMLIAIGCADGVHIISEYYHYLGDGYTRNNALKQTLTNLSLPVILTSLTTSLGFFSLLSAPGVSIRYMGFFLGIGVLSAMLLSLFFIPALLSFIKIRNVKVKPVLVNLNYTKIGNFIINNFKIIIFSSLVILALSVVGIMHVQVETDQIKFLKNNDPLKVATRKIQNNLGGINTLDIIITGSEDSLKEPTVLAFMDNLQRFAEKEEGVSYTLSVCDYIKKIYFEFNGQDESYNRLPNEIEIIDSQEVNGKDINSNLLFLYELGGGDKLKKVVNKDYSRGKISVRLLDTTQLGMEKIINDIDSWVNINKPVNVEVRFSNDYIRIVMDNLIVSSQIRSFAFTLLAILILLVIFFKSPISGVLISLPVAMAVCLNFAVMWLTNTSLNIGTSIIASVGMGVGIDYSIHFYQRYKINYMKSGNNYKSIIETLKTSFIPVMTNAVAVGFGFLALLFSNYFMIISIGWITGLSMFSTAIFALFVLPAFLVWIEPLKSKRAKFIEESRKIS